RTPGFKQRRAAETARWRDRLRRGAAVYPVEIDATTFDLMERFGGLKPDKMDDRHAVAVALGKLLRLALGALLREAAETRWASSRSRSARSASSRSVICARKQPCWRAGSTRSCRSCRARGRSSICHRCRDWRP